MYLPDYWLPRPPMPFDSQAKRACDAFIQNALAHGAATPLDYPLAIPKWQFLCYLVEHYPIRLHGSGNPHITTFEPHQPQDLRELAPHWRFKTPEIARENGKRGMGERCAG